jgi:thioredoxin
MILTQSHGFSPAVHHPSCRPSRRISMLVVLPMVRVAELRRELDERRVDYSDCFDKESLQKRLEDVMEGRIPSGDSSKEAAANDRVDHKNVATTTPDDEQQSAASIKVEDDATTATKMKEKEKNETTTMIFDETKVYEEVRAMKVKELREELAGRRIRWADLFEKSDLVRAVVNARKAASAFSSHITPGTVADLTEEQVQDELRSGSSSTPLLLDVYATWCGPCKMMAKELSSAAEEWQDRIRLAKMDSDQFPNLASTLKVQGLPTIILFDPNGQEVDRLEGALPKAQLMQWVENKLNSSS